MIILKKILKIPKLSYAVSLYYCKAGLVFYVLRLFVMYSHLLLFISINYNFPEMYLSKIISLVLIYL